VRREGRKQPKKRKPLHQINYKSQSSGPEEVEGCVDEER